MKDETFIVSFSINCCMLFVTQDKNSLDSKNVANDEYDGHGNQKLLKQGSLIPKAKGFLQDFTNLNKENEEVMRKRIVHHSKQDQVGRRERYDNEMFICYILFHHQHFTYASKRRSHGKHTKNGQQAKHQRGLLLCCRKFHHLWIVVSNDRSE